MIYIKPRVHCATEFHLTHLSKHITSMCMFWGARYPSFLLIWADEFWVAVQGIITDLNLLSQWNHHFYMYLEEDIKMIHFCP